MRVNTVFWMPGHGSECLPFLSLEVTLFSKPLYYKKAYHPKHTIDRVRKGQEERKLSKILS